MDDNKPTTKKLHMKVTDLDENKVYTEYGFTLEEKDFNNILSELDVATREYESKISNANNVIRRLSEIVKPENIMNSCTIYGGVEDDEECKLPDYPLAHTLKLELLPGISLDIRGGTYTGLKLCIDERKRFDSVSGYYMKQVTQAPPTYEKVHDTYFFNNLEYTGFALKDVFSIAGKIEKVRARQEDVNRTLEDIDERKTLCNLVLKRIEVLEKAIESEE